MAFQTVFDGDFIQFDSMMCGAEFIGCAVSALFEESEPYIERTHSEQHPSIIIGQSFPQYRKARVILRPISSENGGFIPIYIYGGARVRFMMDENDYVELDRTLMIDIMADYARMVKDQIALMMSCRT